MPHDFERNWPTAVVATRDKAVLVTDCSDAAGASEVLDCETEFFRYGDFVIESATAFRPEAFDKFSTALGSALRELSGSSARVGVDSRGLPNRLDDIGGAIDLEHAPNVTGALLHARRTKFPTELTLMRHATALVERGLETAFRDIRAGMTELDMSAVICQSIIHGGGIPRLVAVTSGYRAALVDAYATTRKLQPGDTIRLDIGCTVDGYWSDMARSAIVGEPSRIQRERYDALERGLTEELAVARPGVKAGQLFKTTVETVRRSGIPHYRRHHCGHGIGIQIHEFPILADGSETVLEEGMVLCLETPYYEFGWGALMVENTIEITSSGHDSLSLSPRHLRMIEA